MRPCVRVMCEVDSKPVSQEERTSEGDGRDTVMAKLTNHPARAERERLRVVPQTQGSSISPSEGRSRGDAADDPADPPATALVLRDAAGTSYALPLAVLACYQVPAARLPELAADLAHQPLADPSVAPVVGRLVHTRVHLMPPHGGRW